MKLFHLFHVLLLILPILLLPGCAKNDPVLSINPGLSEYSPAMSSVPGLELIAVLTLDLKNSDVKYHWVAEQGTFLTWHDEGKGQVKELGQDIKTNRKNQASSRLTDRCHINNLTGTIAAVLSRQA